MGRIGPEPIERHRKAAARGLLRGGSAPRRPSLRFYRHQVDTWSMAAAERPQPEVRGPEGRQSISHLSVKAGRKIVEVPFIT